MFEHDPFFNNDPFKNDPFYNDPNDNFLKFFDAGRD